MRVKVKNLLKWLKAVLCGNNQLTNNYKLLIYSRMRNLKMIEKPLVLLFLLCLFPLGISAQSLVKGLVSDESGEPVIGATVRVLGTNDGTVTDLDGRFQVTAKSNAQLSISYIGYVTQKVNVGGAY
jgi:TonB-dependent starch-binding outer membrane protein SusC